LLVVGGSFYFIIIIFVFVYGEKKDYASILDEIELVGLLITPTYIAKSCEFFHLPNYNLHFVLPRRVVRTSVERA
jgi:hypothetical protein